MQHKTTIITILLFLISISLHAQSNQISLTAKNAPIKTVLAEIQQKSGYRILYNDEVVPDDLTVSVNAENVAVKDLLNLMLQNTGLTFVLQNEDLLVITKKEFIETDNQITGLVVDETGEPVPFANVVQLALPDSAFINGVSTAVNGRFSLERKTDKSVLLEVTYLGYGRHHIEVTENNLGNIHLKPETTLLGEVVVTTSRPAHKMEADGIVTSVQNTLLARLGTANDVLGQLPFVKGEDGNYTVFGRGKPLIYINNRLMRDNNELRQLNSGDIKDVKVILTPGSQYDASVGSVIRITTVKPVGEGLSGTLHAYIKQSRRFNHYEFGSLNFRKGGLDIFGDMRFYKTANRQNQRDEDILKLEKIHTTKNNNVLNFENRIWNSTAGINYAFSPTHLMGVRYSYMQYPSSDFLKLGTTEHFVDEQKETSILDDDKRKMTQSQHYVNLYYLKEFSNGATIRLETDYVKSGSTNEQTSNTKNLLTNEKLLVESFSNANSSLYAGKLLSEIPFLKGKITLGSEASYTDNFQNYEMLNYELTDDLPSNFNNSKQVLLAGFASFDRTWENISISAGLRYERIDFDYSLNGIEDDDLSRKYNNVFPTFLVAYQKNNIKMSLSNRTIVRRPNYYDLRSSIAYNNAYTYEGGNPSLLPMYVNKLAYLFGWKDLQMEISYNWIKDYLLFDAVQFKNKPIIFFTTINLPHTQRLNINVNYSPTIGIWRPAFEVGMEKENLIYKGRKYNKPYFTYSWSNILQLPNDYLITMNMEGNLTGENMASTFYSAFKANFRINKRFLNKKLNVSLGVTDIFATNLERWRMVIGNVNVYKWNDRDNRGVYLQATYTFNTARSKYKGQGAANEERNRL